ncbi:hypothetical protein DAH50_26150 [Escherichia coli]|nr:hypothetical protein DAH50_26150 [Escherichia coli]
MPAFEWVHVQLHQQKGMISLSPPTICNSASSCTSERTKFSGFSLALSSDFLPAKRRSMPSAGLGFGSSSDRHRSRRRVRPFTGASTIRMTWNEWCHE